MKKFKNILFFAFAAMFVAVGAMHSFGAETHESILHVSSDPVSYATGAYASGSLAPNIYERGKAFLDQLLNDNTEGAMALKNSLPADLLKAIQNKSVKMDASDLYFRKELSTTNAEFILSTDVKVEGVTNIDRGQLAKGTALILTDFGVKVSNGLTSSNLGPDQVLYSEAIWDLITTYAAGTVDLDAGATSAQVAPVGVQRVPTKLVNGRYMLRFGNEVLHNGLYCQHLVNNLGGVQIPANGMVKLKGPKLVHENGALSLTNYWPLTGTFDLPASSDFFIELQFGGILLSQK